MNLRGKIISGIIVIVLVIIIGVYTSNVSTSKNIVIGVIAPLTGEMANWTDNMKKGIGVAVDEINAKGGVNGKQVQIVYEDNNTCDKAASVSAARKLINVDKIKILMSACSGATLAIAPVAEENKVILLTTLASVATISDAGDYVFRTCSSDGNEGKFLGEFIAKDLNKQKIAIINVINDYGKGFYEGIKTSFEKSGGTVIAHEEYNFESLDFRTSLSKIKASNPDALVIVSYGKEGGLIADQARKLGIDVQFIGTNNFGTQEVVDAGKNAVEGALFSTMYFNEERDVVKEFKTKTEKATGSAPSMMFVAADAYDAVNLLTNAIKEKGYKPDGVKDYLYSVKNYSGLGGNISIDANGDAERESTVQMIKDGKFVPYKK